jgi:hypothetical protein
MQEIATDLLTMSLNLFEMLYDGCDDPFSMPQIIVCTAISLRTLIQTLQARGQTAKAQSCAKTLSKLSSIASKLNDYELITFAVTAAAAA